jgi:putative ABC transport system permease protein
MRSKQTLAMAWANMKQRRLRTSLTTLSVVIGITAVISLASLGEGFRVTITERMEQGFELNALTVIPGSLFAGLSRERFRDESVRNISRIEGVDKATGVMQMGNVTLKNGDREVQAFVATAVNFSEFIGVYPDRFEFETVQGAPGEWKNNTIVIGYKVNHPNETETAFTQASDSINMTYMKTEKIPTPPYVRYVRETSNFTVVGTLQKKGTPGITNFDYWIFIPLDTAREIFNTEESDLIFVKVFDPDMSEQVADEIEALFPPFQVSILVPVTFIRQVDYIIGLIQLFLTSIASISLLVAGIGIMNITTVSVMERTREIGIMKAIGAKNTTILTIFLTESALIGLLGGLIGVPTGYGLSYLLSFVVSRFMGQGQQQGTVLQNPETQYGAITPIFSPAWAIGAMVFGIVICVLFGLYPARKAAKLDPVKALRYE